MSDTFENPDIATTSPKDAVETGIEADDMYRMSKLFVEHLCQLPLPVNVHRVLHGLLHRTCRDLPDWSPRARQPEEGYRARCVVLRKSLGLCGANGNRDLVAGVEAIRHLGFFQAIGFDHGNEWLVWRFHDDLLSAILDNAVYGLLDASALCRLKRPTDYQIFCLTSIVRRMRKPTFTFTVPDAAIWIDKETIRWSDVGAGVIKALMLSCRHYGLTACVLLHRRGMLRGIDTIEVRLRGPGSLWSMAVLAKLHPATEKCVLVDGSGRMDVNRGDFPELVRELRSAKWRLSGLRRPEP
ncbi:hypothetical protein [Pikeienuella sp. HZG-20]|uniref:hypothetical protein n=1 Tax=Paludibacillus litoralis TaxID=3133267 RepID=UPI0030EEEFBF